MSAKPKGTKLRLHRRSELGVHWPKYARMLIQEFTRDCVENGRCYTSFGVAASPLSLNHQYKHIRAYGKNKKTGAVQVFQSKALKPEVFVFRDAIAEAMEHCKTKWSATGTTAAVILFESPAWVTKEWRARKQDADNKVKPLFDAIEKASLVPDELHWSFHVFKVASARERTLVYLFDLGDVIEYFTEEHKGI